MASIRFLPNILANVSLRLGRPVSISGVRYITRGSRIRRTLILCGLCACLLSLRTFASDVPPPWIEVHAKHFVVTTDATEKSGREVAFRLEQMRAVFGSLLLKNRLNQAVPISIIALKDDGEYSPTAPASAEGSTGFLLPGEDRVFIVLNVSKDESWRAIAHDFARLFLTYNYPPTQDWFDEGFAEYFSSIRLDDKQVEVGAGPSRRSESLSGSLTELLNTPDWMSVPDLFAAHRAAQGQGKDAALFEAQSWMVVHYILDKNLLPQTGTYFGLVQNEKAPLEQAMAKAFNMSSSQFGEAVRAYYRSLSWQPSAPAARRQGEARDQSALMRFPSPIGPDDFGMTVTRLPDVDARALLADARSRAPGRHEQGVKDLKDLAADPNNNELAHRALAWAFIEDKNFEAAVDELGTAAELNQRDPWVRYYLSVLKYRIAQTNHQAIQGLANMMQDLRAVLDWYPEFGEAYNMLAMARVEGGGPASALEAIRAAIQISPRNETYLYNLGLVYALGKKWEAARAVFERVKSSGDAQLSAAASDQLSQMETVQKYGIAAARPALAPPEKPAQSQAAAPSGPSSKNAAAGEAASADTNDTENQATKPEAPVPLSGPILYAKGKLISVDCSKDPVALLKMTVAGKTMELRTENYKSLPVIGADSFSCTWASQPISVNYRASGKTAGVLVSVELP